ncbi:MAG TPA: DUF998 domain-containing protein [Lacibacter sp.]|nr:DUF998 domain-containing protein [Lacibacter sp.]HMO89944.1 DUF998 domain-containing protein [Lacibacter sp.]HMP88187.1 DUF998 domain-containing protein [Lacibacter sp.]
MSRPDPSSPQSLVISYLTLRKAVGLLGMVLPFLLLLGWWALEQGCRFPPSISHFYYTNMGDVFVGTLCAVSLFLFSYNGYDANDRWAAKAAGLFALLVALFPTNFGNYTPDTCSRMTDGTNDFANVIHYGAALLFFGTLTYFCLFLFTRSSQRGPVKGNKKIRNNIYIICGWVMVACMVLLIVVNFLPADAYRRIRHLRPVYTLETIALLAFGYSWLIKGDTFFRDAKP